MDVRPPDDTRPWGPRRPRGRQDLVPSPKVLNVITAHEVGTVINPLTHQGQIDGGFVTGLGLAVTEELVSEGGQILNGHFAHKFGYGALD